MPRDLASVSATTTIDLAGVEGRLREGERQVLVRHERRVLGLVRERWVGWLYRGRPENAPRNVSYRAWKSTLQTTTAPYAIAVSNEARSYAGGYPYVAHVHRTGQSRPEYLVVRDAWTEEIVPGLVAELAAAALRSMEPRERKELRSRGKTERVVRTVEG